MPPSLTLWRPLLAAAAVCFLLTACDRTSTEPAVDTASTVISQYPQPRILADFSLQNRRGETVGKTALTERWHLLFFGFTHCPDICPTTLQRLSLVQTGWPAEAEPPAVVLVSVDPDRDDPARMDRYLGAFQGELQGLTGDYRQIRALAAQLGARIVRAETPGASPDHSAAVYLINPDGNLAAVIAPDFEPEALTRTLFNLIGAQPDAQS